MQKRISTKKLLLALTMTVLLSLVAKNAYESHKLSQRFKEEEIYMFRDTYTFIVNQRIIAAYCMVCDPVDDKILLVEKLERLIKEKGIVQGAKDYYSEKFGEKYGYDDLCIYVRFYRSSKEFPIGWQPEKGYTMEDYQEISYNLLLSIDIPWDAVSADEHTYYIWRYNEPLNDMDLDAYSRRTQEDGSFILIPKN